MHGKRTDPYRLFFPLGILLGIAGVSIWPLYYFGVTEGYSGRAHAFLQTGGFLYCFIAGFLLTAIPRFTGTEAPSRPVQFFLAAIICVSAAAFELLKFQIGHGGFVAAHVTVITLAVRRFVRRSQDPPNTFALVGAGMIAGAAGAFINAFVAWEWIRPDWDPLGKRLLTEGMVLLLVLGIGGFLGPRLLGFDALPKFLNITMPDGQRKKFKMPPRQFLLFLAAGIVVLLTLVLEYGFAVASMAFVRAAAATAVIMVTIRPWRRPAVRTTLAWSVWTAIWLVVLGVWISALSPRYRVDLLHILFMGGFTLLILAVGTRVTLSHGGYPLSKEKRSWPLRIGVSMVLIAMLARVGAPFASLSFFEHLALAAILWIAGMLFWGAYIVRLIRGAPPS